jgi:hypothetical protein
MIARGRVTGASEELLRDMVGALLGDALWPEAPPSQLRAWIRDAGWQAAATTTGWPAWEADLTTADSDLLTGWRARTLRAVLDAGTLEALFDAPVTACDVWVGADEARHVCEQFRDEALARLTYLRHPLAPEPGPGPGRDDDVHDGTERVVLDRIHHRLLNTMGELVSSSPTQATPFVVPAQFAHDVVSGFLTAVDWRQATAQDQEAMLSAWNDALGKVSSPTQSTDIAALTRTWPDLISKAADEIQRETKNNGNAWLAGRLTRLLTVVLKVPWDDPRMAALESAVLGHGQIGPINVDPRPRRRATDLVTAARQAVDAALDPLIPYRHDRVDFDLQLSVIPATCAFLGRPPTPEVLRAMKTLRLAVDGYQRRSSPPPPPPFAAPETMEPIESWRDIRWYYRERFQIAIFILVLLLGMLIGSQL